MRRFAPYVLAVVLLGLRVLELNAGLPLVWHRLALLTLGISMCSLAFALIRLNDEADEPIAGAADRDIAARERAAPTPAVNKVNAMNRPRRPARWQLDAFIV
jgi:hypothetical protein